VDLLDSSRSFRIAWGTTPGGPYPNVGPSVVGNNSVDQPVNLSIAGLNDNTTYYYVVQTLNGVDVVETSGECNFTTLEAPIIIDPCEPATNVTPFSATLNASAQNVPAGFTYRFRYGTTPGGPYTSTVAASTPPGGVATGASPENYSVNIAGLTPGTQYYYVSEVLNGAQQVVATGGECTFTTEGAVGPGGFVYWCGRLVDTAECTFVDTANDDYWNCNEV
jgi:hypothetical protein